MNSGRILLFFVATIVAGSLPSSEIAADSIACRVLMSKLRCEHLVDPLGIDDVERRLVADLSAKRASETAVGPQIPTASSFGQFAHPFWMPKCGQIIQPLKVNIRSVTDSLRLPNKTVV